MKNKIKFVAEGHNFSAELHPERAPESVSVFKELLPLESELMHVRWSGYATWINIEDIVIPDLPRENHTVYPSRGEILLYPGYKNDQEILVPCGPTCFKSPAGEIAGNHIATLDATPQELSELEKQTLQDGSISVQLLQ